MLSLILGVEISDASVAAIASSYSNLELLDLSGYVYDPYNSISLPPLLDKFFYWVKNMMEL